MNKVACVRSEMPTAEALVEEACQQTGLSDFGPETFREGLEVYLGEIRREPRFPEPYVNQLLAIVRRRLKNRLEIEATFRNNPDIALRPIDSLVSITGLPRTGTTALGNILSQDAGFRAPRTWEQAQPCPPPVLEDEQNDPRRLAAVQLIERLRREQPELMAMHLFDADTAEEDLEILGLDFKTQQLSQPLFDYHRWWRTANLTPTFAYHRRVLQLLQWKRPPHRWLLKCPAHMFHLDALVAAYPNARIIMTHRDPAKTIPSMLSLLAALLPPDFAKALDWKAFGAHMAENQRVGLERAMASRARLGEARFLDVYHHDFNRDPFGTLHRVYAFLDLEFHPQARQAMERWHGKNQSGAHGAHRYDSATYGLTADQIRSDFDFYIRHFSVPCGA